MKILIAYASRYGATEEVARFIANHLAHHQTTLLDVKEKDANPSAYDFIVVGSGIRNDRWVREATRFVERHHETLSHKPHAVFVCSGFAISKKAWAEQVYCKEVMNGLGLHPMAVLAVPGVFDFSRKSRQGFLGRRVLRLAAKRLEEDGVEIDYKGRNDFRDWEQIRAWVSKLVG